MFKQDFKYYKSKKPPPDLSNVLDFNNSNLIIGKVRQIRCEIPNEELHGLKPVQQWHAYELLDNPGLIFIRNPFTSYGQRYWIIRCLRDYTKKPNKLNVDIHDIVPTTQDWWEMCQDNKNENIINKLRWATLGYHHNWDTKIYSEDLKNTFPKDLAVLSKYFANVLGYKDFNAEAAIVNYYHMDSTLSGHTDHSEQYLEAPLFSFSFGQSAIFLLGGTTLDVKPTAMFLHSGDVVVMSKESRLCYHGVPKIITAPQSLWNSNDSKYVCKNENIMNGISDEDFSKPFETYIEHSRINMNVRQVLKSSEQSLNNVIK
ncbi:hypothetical protein ILUMI_05548 [Ignelater luminosus]|uniref:Fe2OG dioxygenase domain-containing protein n=1 Tax=Ignelater luminosus TaxID=2038154 RepID=A0A8K0D6X3_IGNLU|nr:hypothetical protein ILUMI_05548 [Ignelater luminosus]